MNFNPTHPTSGVLMSWLALGLPVRFVQTLGSSTAYYLVNDYQDPFGIHGLRTLVFFSQTALVYALVGVRWHDDPDHCRTWSDGCRCDLGDEA